MTEQHSGTIRLPLVKLTTPFNSLDAQREASEAFIQSQRHEGWTMLADRYDDGGVSGATMERPALKQLLHDIEAGKVIVVVVYKVDRLTRALSDFAKMIDLFDRHRVSFVSVTQQFNTTSSMGRLMLNVLLSFAQFEREVTGERIRDKIAASKKKGMWMGGIPPLGYDIADRKLIANADEARIVRWMFQHYLELGSINRLRTNVLDRGITTKTYTSETGCHWGDGPFGRSALHCLLGNPIYIGNIVHKGNVYSGEHDGIVDRDLWDRAQAALQKHRRHEGPRGSAKQASLLKGLIFDAAGDRLTPVHANKRGKRYVSNGIITSASTQPKDGVWRIPAHEIEQLVVFAVKNLLKDRARLYDIIVARDQHLGAAAATYQRLADIVETILAGRQPPTLMAEHLIKTNLPLQWHDQRRVLGFTI